MILLTLTALGVNLSAQTTPGPLSLPATFTGTVPCADCPGIAVTLTLYPDRTFFLRRVYQGRETKGYESGKYSFQSGGSRLVLQGSPEGAQQFAVNRKAASLTMLDRAGKPIDSKLNYTLTRAAQVDPIYERMRWRGMYVYMADSASFTDCATGRRFALSPSDQSPAMERGYAAARTQPGAPVLVEFEGRRGKLPNMEGKQQEMVVVDQFGQFLPGKTCATAGGARAGVSELAGTEWQLSRLNGKPIAADLKTKPTLKFDATGARISGSTGCNGMFGSVEQSADTVKFSQLGTTMRACLAEDAGRLESEYTKAFAGVTGYRIVDGSLLLYAGSDEVAAFDRTEMTAAARPTGVLGTEWYLVSLQGSAVEVKNASQRPHFTIDPGTRRISGSTGCNRLMGEYGAPAPGKVHFSKMATSRRACLDPASAQLEMGLIQALKDASSLRVANARLILLSEAGEVAVFERGDEDSAAAKE